MKEEISAVTFGDVQEIVQDVMLKSTKKELLLIAQMFINEAMHRK